MNRNIKIFLIVFISFSIDIFIYAQDQKTKIAVLEVAKKNVEQEKCEVIYRYIIDYINKHSENSIIENSKFNKILIDIQLNNSIKLDYSKVIEIGKALGAEYIIIPSLIKANGIYYILIRLISVNTDELDKTDIKTTIDFNKTEDIVYQSLEYLIGMIKIAPKKLNLFNSNRMQVDYFSCSLKAGTSIALGDFSNVQVQCISSIINIDYNFNFGWCTIGAGLFSGFNLYGAMSAKTQNPYGFDIYSVPIALHLKYEVDFIFNTYIFLDAAAGIIISLITFLEDYPNREDSIELAVYSCPSLGLGYRIFPSIGIVLYANISTYFFRNTVYNFLMLPGWQIDINIEL